VGNGRVTLSWTSVSGAACYKISKKQGNNPGWSTILNIPGTAYIDTKVFNGTGYEYKVNGVTAAGVDGDLSNECDVTPGVSAIGTYPINVVADPLGPFTDTPLTLPDWLAGTISSDESSAPGSGPSGALSVSLPFGVEESDIGPDLVAPNLTGDSVAFERSYRTPLASASLSSPGLPAGWVHNWDFKIVPLSTSGWGPLLLVYPSGANEVLQPNFDSNNNPDGTFNTELGVPYKVKGIVTDNAWSCFKLSYNDNESQTFEPAGGWFLLTKVRGSNKNSISIGYNTHHAIDNVKDSAGNVLLQFAYDATSFLLTSVTNPGSSARTIYYDETNGKLNYVSRLNDQTHADYLYYYAGVNGFLSSIGTASGSAGHSAAYASVGYEQSTGRATNNIDANGNQRLVNYQSTYTNVQIADGQSNVTDSYSVAFDQLGRRTAWGGPASGDITQIQYDTVNNPGFITAVSPPLPGNNVFTSTATPDSAGNPTSTVDDHGIRTNMVWEYPTSCPDGRLISSQTVGTDGSQSALTTITYYADGDYATGHYAGRVSSITMPSPVGDGTNITLTYHYTALGNLLTVTAPTAEDGYCDTTYSYVNPSTGSEEYGRLYSVTDPMGYSVHYTYWPNGQLASSTDKNGKTTTFTYTGEQLSGAVLPEGSGHRHPSVSITHDVWGKPATDVSLSDDQQTPQLHEISHPTTNAEWATSASTGSSLSVSAQYDPNYQLKAVSDQRGSSSNVLHGFSYFPSTLTTQYAMGGNAWTSKLNLNGLLSSVTSPKTSGNNPSYTGTPTTQVAPDDANGDRPMTVTHDDGSSTNYTYDGLGRVKTVQDDTGDSSNAGTVLKTYTYDKLGNVTGIETHFVTQGLTSTSTYTYYPDGSRKYMTVATPGGTYVYVYHYDKDGRMSSVELCSGSAGTPIDGDSTTSNFASVKYTYDANGNVLSAKSGAVYSYFVYDDLGRLLSLLNLSAATVGTVASDYSSMADPDNSSIGHLVLSNFTNIGYDGLGNRNATDFWLGRPCDRTGAAVYVSNLVEAPSQSSNVSGSVSFQYDEKSQLTNETWHLNPVDDPLVLTHQYDAAGNPTTIRGQSPTIDPTTDQLTAGSFGPLLGLEGTVTGSYDYDGNLSQMVENDHTAIISSLNYDSLDQLVGITVPTSGGTPAYGYTSDGWRFYKDPQTSGLVPSVYLYDGDNLIGELGPTGAIQHMYLWGATGLSMRVSPGSGGPLVVAYSFDPSGNRIGRHPCENVSGGAYATTSIAQYDGYGRYNVREDSGLLFDPNQSYDIMEPIGFKGQAGCYTDAESGLVYCHNRYYSPSMGRWISRDPTGLEAGLNVYSFCENNPIMGFDPSGLDGDDSWWSGFCGVIKGYGKAIGGAIVGVWHSSPVYVIGSGQAVEMLRDPVGTTRKRWEGVKQGAIQFWAGLKGERGAEGFGDSFGTLLIAAGSAGAGGAEGAAGKLFSFGTKGAAVEEMGIAAAGGRTVAEDVADWLGAGTKRVTNKAGDEIFVSADGLRKVRFDFIRPNPHINIHMHFEVLRGGKWLPAVAGKNQIYPIDVPHY
jgi:RHS repeat-associated protein